MRPIIRLALTALVIAPSIATLDAQSNNAFAAGSGSRSSITSGSARLTYEETRIVSSWVDDADRYALIGRLHDARRLLREVVAIQERGGAYTAPTLRRLANVEFALNRPLVAAGVLEDVAFAANTIGDPETEIQALVDAMVVYGQEGRSAKASALRPRVQRLMHSPAITSELREKLARHLITG